MGWWCGVVVCGVVVCGVVVCGVVMCGVVMCGVVVCGVVVWGGDVWGGGVWCGGVWGGDVWGGDVWGGDVWGGDTCFSSHRFSLAQCKALKAYALQMVSEQIGGRGVQTDANMKNSLKFLMTAAGMSEVRLLIVQRIEGWIQNPKAGRGAGGWDFAGWQVFEAGT